MLAKENPEPTITIQLTKIEFQTLFAAAANYYDYLGSCTMPEAAREVVGPLLNEMEDMDIWQ